MKFAVVDSGSSRARFAIYKNNNIEIIETKGINPSYMDERKILEIIKEIKPYVKGISAIYYYSAGCSSLEKASELQRILTNFLDVSTYVFHDILGTARALFNNTPGIACIIGTGSNSAYYNGKDVIEELIPGGYLIGDEGGATHLAKLFIKYLIYNKLPPFIQYAFCQKFSLTPHQVISNCYGNEPVSFLSNIAKFIIDIKEDSFIQSHIIVPSLSEFIKFRVIPLYEKYHVPVGFSGSVAYLLKEFLQPILHPIPISSVKKEIITDLINFHKENF